MQKSTPATTNVATNRLIPNIPLVIGVAALFILGLALTVPGQHDWWQVLVLGVVQGLTEFLPISSTGHLLITSDLLGFQGSMGGTFEIFIQFGTVLAVIGYYIRDLLTQARAVIGQQTTDAETQMARRLWLGIAVAFMPAAIIGLTLHDWIKAVLFESPAVIASSLIIGGIIFIVIERLPQRASVVENLEQVSWRQALGIGVAQVFALIPGMSRSGSSIVGGLLANLDRRTATAFSFYLAIPTLGAATMVDLLGSIDLITRDDIGRLLLGTVVAMIVGWLSIGWLLRYVANHSFVAFGVYRIVVGLLILALVWFGHL